MSEALKRAREATPSRRHPGTCMGRSELASLVADWITEHGETHTFDANHLGKLERGIVHRPSDAVRAALCAILDRPEDELFANTAPTAPQTAPADPNVLTAVKAVLASVRKLEDASGPANVLPTVDAQRALVLRVLDGVRSPAQRRQALSLLSNIETYQGWLALSLERWGESRRHLDRACVLAIEADNPTRLATALSFLAYRTQLRGDLAAARDQCDAAIRHDRAHEGLFTYLHYQRAEALALNRERGEAQGALRTADSLAAHMSGGTGAWYSPAFFVGHRALVLNALNDRAARRVASEALELMPDNWQDQPMRIRQTGRRLLSIAQ